MSYDIILLKPADPRTDDLSNIEDVVEMGEETSIITSIEQVFPGCTQGVFTKDESFTVEGSLSGNPVTSIHLSLRFGSAWSDSSFNVFLGQLSQLCNSLQAHAYSVSDNSLIAAPE